MCRALTGVLAALVVVLGCLSRAAEGAPASVDSYYRASYCRYVSKTVGDAASDRAWTQRRKATEGDRDIDELDELDWLAMQAAPATDDVEARAAHTQCVAELSTRPTQPSSVAVKSTPAPPSAPSATSKPSAPSVPHSAAGQAAYCTILSKAAAMDTRDYPAAFGLTRGTDEWQRTLDRLDRLGHAWEQRFNALYTTATMADAPRVHKEQYDKFIAEYEQRRSDAAVLITWLRQTVESCNDTLELR